MDLLRPQMMADRQKQARRLELQNRPYWERRAEACGEHGELQEVKGPCILVRVGELQD